MPKANATKTANFEKSLTALEELVENLEDGELPLEKALDHYEKGIKLAKDCQLSLKSAELRVKTLMEENNKVLDDLSESDIDDE